MIRHHPSFELLFDYATGAQPEPVMLAVATHVELCSACRRLTTDMEAVGGVMLDDLVAADAGEASNRSLEAVFDAIDRTDTRVQPGPYESYTIDGFLPRALRPYLKEPLEHLPWRSIESSFEEALLPNLNGRHRASILRAERNVVFPIHSHRGQEFLAVLHGGFRSNGNRFERGDFVYCDATATHELLADTHDNCICLLVLDAPLSFFGNHQEVLDPVFQW